MTHRLACRLGVLLLLAALAPRPARAAPVASTGRGWAYAALTVPAAPWLSFTAMPGLRYEFARSPGAIRQHYLDELFVGPNVQLRLGPVRLKTSLWYYFTGFPQQSTGAYESAHSLELVPTVEYTRGRWLFSDRVILHNTFWAGVYDTARQRWGYGLVMRNLLQVRYAATPALGLTVGDEPFLGLVEDAQAPVHPLGYWQQGLRLNRLYLGCDYRFNEAFAVTPQYVWETSFDSSGRLAERGHYLFLVFSYLLRLG